ncbi:Hypothetical protein PHPALM_15304 [Phytophthora palmivora]|uniref:Carbohydrate-binding protein n=1 Tax=Phytophthora palmivora TaxID=4796 RepID=A0A2P4XSH4_9STRA|nr:Hypothetical protein PHPALM_15304 [Phytophthora palmivora]
MNPGKFFASLTTVALALAYASATEANPVPANVPIYYGRPNNGGYPYPTVTPQATNLKNKTEAPVPGNGPIYYGRPNNGGYPYVTPTPHNPEGSTSGGSATPPPNAPIYYGRPNNGGYPYPNDAKEN